MSVAAPRVAFFADCYYEVNGVSLTCRKLEEFARGRNLPLLMVRGGPAARATGDVVEYKRSRLAFPIDVDMRFDPLFLLRQAPILEAVADFRPDVIHVTGPGDCGVMGAIVAHRLRAPLVASWHTNLHAFAERRLAKTLSWMPARWRAAAARFARRETLRWALRFYRIPRISMAPNPELIALLEQGTGKPAFLMRRGVECDLFSPQRRSRTDGAFVIGFVGRLQPEKNVRLLASIEQRLLDAGERDFRFLVVGHGSERTWLEQNMRHVECTGALRGEDLWRAYANMDLFVFPSETDTFGNVVQEALASGVPAVVSNEGGPKFLVRPGETGFVADSDAAFGECIRVLMHAPEKRAAMRQAARASALDSSWDRVCEDVFAVYRRVLAG